MIFLKRYLYGAAAFFVLGLVIGAYVKGRADANAVCATTVAAIYAEAEAQKDAEAEKARQTSARLEKQNASARIIYRDIVHEVEKIVDRPVYRNVCLDDDGVRLANAALAGQAAAPAEPDSAVSDPQSTDGRAGVDGPP